MGAPFGPALVVGALALLAPALCADVVILPAAKDATIFNDPNGGRADGAQATFYAGRSNSMATYPVKRALLEFDVAAAVPAGSTVQSVQLKLYMSQTTSGSKTFELKRLTTDWNEGPTVGQSGNGAAAQVGDSTWKHTYWNTTLWTTLGGDFVSTASASASVGGSGFYNWNSTAQLVSDVQLFLDAPAQNFGWILIGPEGSGQTSAKQFEGRLSFMTAWRPALTITYTLPPPTVYCTPKINSQGCVPAIGFSGTPDANAGSGFVIQQTNAINQKLGLLFYGTSGPKGSSFQGGTLCVNSPTKRTPAQNSAGNAPPDDCSGVFGYDFNVRIASGTDPALVAGALVWAQYWSRDPADPWTTNLSDGLKFTILP